MGWVKKNVKELALLLSIAIALVTMTAYVIGSIHGVETRITSNMNDRFSKIEKDITIIKTVLMMRGILPQDLAIVEKEKPAGGS